MDSDWKQWMQIPGKIKDGTDAGNVIHFWEHFDQSFELAQGLGANAFRLSIAWERVEPKPGYYDEAALDHYVRMIEALRRRHLEPIVTLHHFVLPAWLVDRGGLLAPEFIASFSSYARKVVTRLAASPLNVKYFMTFNEPMVLINAGYLNGEWPPGLKDPSKALQAAAQIARAHIAAYKNIKSQPDLSSVQLSIAKHWRVFEGKGLLGPVLSYMSDWAFNRQMMKALLTGKLFFWMPGAASIREDIALLEGHQGFLDYIGINYYGRIFTSFKWQAPFVNIDEGPGPKNDLGWEIFPEGLCETLKDVNRYHLPILISENGTADAKDAFRSQFLEDHLKQMKKAYDEGIPVIGYLHWSLTDNFEWAEGLKPRFGLVSVDYQTQKLTPRRSYQRYKELIDTYQKAGLK